MGYSKDNRSYTYEDIYNFIYRENKGLKNNYPEYITNIEPKKKKKSTKKNLEKCINIIQFVQN